MIGQRAGHALGEFADGIDAVYDAIPKRIRKKLERDGKLTRADKLRAIWHFDKQINWNQAVSNFWTSQGVDGMMGGWFKFDPGPNVIRTGVL